MNYILKTTFLDEKISYNLMNGKFNIPDTPNSLSSDVTFETIVKHGIALKQNSDFMCITIATTDACNLECTYCFEKHSNHFLTKDCIPVVCNLIQEYKKNNPHISRVVIIWFGGEPLLNLNFILKASKCVKKICEELSLVYSGRIITNGVDLNKMIPYVKELCITDIQITLDGTQEFHDCRRVKANGVGSFDEIISNIQNIQSKVNLIIRMNIDRNNISECYKLYDYIQHLSLSQEINVFFQPMLVENYGGESSCYEGLILNNEELNEEYLDLLEYTNCLEYPKYIGAFCNVDFPSSLVIRPDTSLCKCWAEVVESSNSSVLINNNTKINDILCFMKHTKHFVNRIECEECNIYPTCLGGCLYKNYTSSECNMKRKNVLSTIHRLYFKERVKDNISFQILNNEMIWLRSIGCKIRYQNGGIEISRNDLCTTDFNFFIGADITAKCIRLSQMMPTFLSNEKKLFSYNYQKLSGYDINYFHLNHKKSISESRYTFEKIAVDVWEEYGFIRNPNKYVHYYNIKLDNIIIGKFSIVITDIIGIYDFEIFKSYQRLGHGTRVLHSLTAKTDKNLFIQTWNDNHVAQRCYENAGFIKYELLYRYNK